MTLQVYEAIRAKQSERGITTAELSRRTEIPYEALRYSLKGERNITSEEFVSLCIELGMDIDDFIEQEVNH